MKDSPQPAKRRRYNAALRAEALCLAEQSRLTHAAARVLNINAKLLYKWQKEALTPVAAARGAELDPATAAELRQLRTLTRRQAQELEDLKKSHCHLLGDRQSMSRYRFTEAQRSQYPMRLLCQVVAVPASGYYAWQVAQEQVASEQLPAWEEALVKVFGRHLRRYGTHRLQVALRGKGYRIGRRHLRTAIHRRLDPRAAVRPQPRRAVLRQGLLPTVPRLPGPALAEQPGQLL